MVHALRVFRVLAALCLLGAFSEIASAEGVCAAELCERDCKNTVPSILGRHDPRQYEACLAAERACREGIPAIEAACQVSQNYQAGLLWGRRLSVEACSSRWTNAASRPTGLPTSCVRPAAKRWARSAAPAAASSARKSSTPPPLMEAWRKQARQLLQDRSPNEDGAAKKHARIGSQKFERLTAPRPPSVKTSAVNSGEDCEPHESRLRSSEHALT